MNAQSEGTPSTTWTDEAREAVLRSAWNVNPGEAWDDDWVSAEAVLTALAPHVAAREAATELLGYSRALTAAADFLGRVTEIGEKPRRDISDEDWEFYCANRLLTRAEIADWLRACAADETSEGGR